MAEASKNAAPMAICQEHGHESTGKRHFDVPDTAMSVPSTVDEDTVPQAKINRLARTVSLRNGSIKVREALIDLRSFID
jgi:hypothetical protein